MSSSNRSAGQCDAVVMHREQAVGPVRLPMVRPNDFIEYFNRTYGSAGLTLQRIENNDVVEDEKKILGDSKRAAEDHDFQSGDSD